MSSHESDESSTSNNPYQSPEASTEQDTRVANPHEIKPDKSTIWAGILLGVLAQVFVDIEGFLHPERALLKLPDLIQGVIVGLGIAVFVDAIRRNLFGKLMPGHWCLIATIPVTIAALIYSIFLSEIDFSGDYSVRGLILPIVASGLIISSIACAIIFAFYLAVLCSTEETKTWKVFAWAQLLLAFNMTLSGIVFLTFQDLSQSSYEAFSGATSTVIGLCRFVSFGAFLLGYGFDLKTRRRRDTYHYLGIAAVAIQIVLLPLLGTLLLKL